MKTLLTVLLTSALLGMSASAWADDGGAVLGDKTDSAVEKATFLALGPTIKPEVAKPVVAQPNVKAGETKNIHPRPSPYPVRPRPKP